MNTPRRLRKDQLHQEWAGIKRSWAAIESAARRGGQAESLRAVLAATMTGPFALGERRSSALHWQPERDESNMGAKEWFAPCGDSRTIV